MMSRTGNRGEGFTFIEVMVAACVLALGAVLLYEAFFISLDAFELCDNYLYALTVADEKIWEAQDALRRSAALEKEHSQEQFVFKGKVFNLQLSSQMIKESKDRYKLFRVELAIEWLQGRRQSILNRSAYAMYRPPPQS